MRFSLQALLLAILVIAVGLAIVRWMRGDYPQGAITVVCGPRAGQPSGTPAWSVVRFDDRIVCRSANPVTPCTVFASPFPFDPEVKNPRMNVVLMPFGLIGRRSDGTHGLLTVAPASRDQQSVMTPYGPAVPIGSLERRYGRPAEISFSLRLEPSWREWLSVRSDGADGVIVDITSDEPTYLSGDVRIRDLLEQERANLPSIQTEIPPNGQAQTHFTAVPNGVWYVECYFSTSETGSSIPAKPVCFEKRQTHEGLQVIEFR